MAETLTRVVGAPVPLLGEMPIDLRLREAGDSGMPLVLADPGRAGGPGAAQDRRGPGRQQSRSLAGRQLGLTPA